VPLTEEEREDEAAKLLSRLDENDDGVLEFEEFEAWFRLTVDSITKFRQSQGDSKQTEGSTTDELLTVLASTVHDKRALRLQQHQAASTIERAARQRQERKRAAAAAKIEAAARGRRERKELAKRQQAASKIGAAARGRRQRSKYNHATATPIDKQLVQARRVFDALDADGNGVLTGDELTQLANWVFEKFHPGDVPLTEEEREDEAAKLLSRLDENDDGVLEFEEFEAWFRKTCDSIVKFQNQRVAKTSSKKRPATKVSSPRPVASKTVSREQAQENLLAAAKSGSLADLKQALSDGAKPNSTGAKGNTALMVASQHKHEEVVSELLKCGTKIDLQDNTGWTALMFAAWFGAVGPAKLLVGANAVRELKNSDGRTALDMARICAGFAKGDKTKADVLALLEGKPASSTGATTAAQVDEDEYLEDGFEDEDSPKKSAGAPAEEMDLWGDGGEEDDAASQLVAEKAAAFRKQREEAKAAKGQQMATVVLNVKPWDDTTDMAELEAQVRKVCHSSGPEAIQWGESYLVDVGYGIKSLKITCRIIRETVSIEIDLVRFPRS
jgi:Ca2+-binding EF-hand superfamily protein/translation elongation factor EF-1beta